jgi:sirohydrochlorin cobaltochelatase
MPKNIWNITTPKRGANETAVLIVGHGTRELEGTYAFLELVSSVQKQIRSYVQPAFLEIASPSVPEGASYCLSTGAKRMLVIPFFLFGGHDVKKKLPQALEKAPGEAQKKARMKYPPLAVTVSSPIGPDRRIIEILKERLSSATGPSSDTAVLLVGRGSSDPDAVAGMQEVSDRFAEETGLPTVRHAFVEIASPSVPDGIRACLASQTDRIVVLPYLLFPGVVMKKINSQVEAIPSRQTGRAQIIVANCLGPHPKLTELLLERIRKEL